MQRTEVAIPGRSPRKSTGGGVDGGGGGPETEAGASGGSADGDGGAPGGEAGPAGDASVGEAAADASASRRVGDASAGDQAQGGRGGDNNDDDELPATFQGIELTTPHQSWTFFPDWRPLREVLVKEVAAMAESATESTRLAAEKAQEVVVRTEQVRRAKRKGPVEGNHKMQVRACVRRAAACAACVLKGGLRWGWAAAAGADACWAVHVRRAGATDATGGVQGAGGDVREARAAGE